ncbi:MAG: hypothetical protein A2X49_09340 [Lentisphaerae bacterium GWF2_52_8]|nr:MAG: hypothetical protein A2X49_09340 [Lentisphaerae bacterium GWF2_52_8]
MANIIVADDDKLVRVITESVLKGAEHIVRTAKDGDEALQLADEKPPDIMITDIFMPGKNGLEAILEVRRKYPKIGIIAISGNSATSDGKTSDYLDFARDLGADCILEKPVASKQLLEAVSKMLGQP